MPSGRVDSHGNWVEGRNPFAVSDLEDVVSMRRDDLGVSARTAVEGLTGHELDPAAAAQLDTITTKAHEEIQAHKSSPSKVREIFAELCYSIGTWCEKSGWNKAANYFKDLAESIIQNVPRKEITRAREEAGAKLAGIGMAYEATQGLSSPIKAQTAPSAAGRAFTDYKSGR
jgi:hypothetical protein